MRDAASASFFSSACSLASSCPFTCPFTPLEALPFPRKKQETFAPCCASLAMVPPHPSTSSSGWAATTSTEECVSIALLYSHSPLQSTSEERICLVSESFKAG